MSKIRVTIWNEFRHEKTDEEVRALYPDGIHAYLAKVLASDDLEITPVALDDPDQGLTEELLNSTDVLVWWAHMYHWDVTEELAERVAERVFQGMGLICLHSSHYSKPFRKTVGTTGHLTWGDEVREIVWNVAPTHPIAAGIPSHFVLEKEEIYGEPFQIPEPDEQIFLGWFESGHVFRSGCLWRRGYGKIFYFQPGHETVPTFYNEYVQKIIANAIRYVAPAYTEGYRLQNGSPYIGSVAPDGEREEFVL